MIRTMRQFIGFGFLTAIILLAVVSPAWAQGGDEYPEGVDPDRVYDLADTIYCDVCAGVSVAYCPSPQCQAWREEIADLVALGRSDDDIRQHFADRYGEQVTGVPISEANRRFTYAIPIILIGLAALLIGWQIWQWRQRESRGLAVARTAGTLEGYDRPVPDNVDPIYLESLLKLLEERG